nr:MAG: hypothetical protein DiTV3a_F2ORF6 [Diabrotica toursvirus 3a]
MGIEELHEHVSFVEKIVLNVIELDKKTIMSKITNKNYYSLPFEINTITDFKILELKIYSESIIGTLLIYADVYKPTPGKIITISNFKIYNDNNIIFSSKRIQLMATATDILNTYTIQINEIKILGEYILCVGTVIN